MANSNTRGPRRFDPHRQERSDDGNAFVPDPADGGEARAPDDLAEELAEEFVSAATSGEDADERLLDAEVPEEIGGPFIETTAADEFGNGTDDMNPPDAMAEPLPRATAGLVTPPPADASLDADADEEMDDDGADSDVPADRRSPR